MDTSTIRIFEIWGAAWDTTKKHFTALIGIALAVFGIGMFSDFIQDTVFPLTPKEVSFGRLGMSFLFGCIQFAVSLGWIRVCLRFVDGKQGTLGDLTSAISCLPTALLQMFLMGLLMLALCLPLFILIMAVGPSPAVLVLTMFMFLGLIFWVMLRYSFSFYLIIDKGMGAIEAMAESARLSKEIKGALILNNLLGMILVGLASLPIVIPMVMQKLEGAEVTFSWWMHLYALGQVLVLPLFGVASAYLYRRAQKQADLSA